jgi:hypothetical protein
MKDGYASLENAETEQQAREQAKVNEVMMRRLSNPEAVIAALEEPTEVTA